MNNDTKHKEPMYKTGWRYEDIAVGMEGITCRPEASEGSPEVASKQVT